MIWEKTAPNELSSSPARYIIRAHQHGYYKSYEAIDTLAGGAFTARRGIHMGSRNMLKAALDSIKAEVEEYDGQF